MGPVGGIDHARRHAHGLRSAGVTDSDQEEEVRHGIPIPTTASGGQAARRLLGAAAPG